MNRLFSRDASPAEEWLYIALASFWILLITSIVLGTAFLVVWAVAL